MVNSAYNVAETIEDIAQFQIYSKYGEAYHNMDIFGYILNGSICGLLLGVISSIFLYIRMKDDRNLAMSEKPNPVVNGKHVSQMTNAVYLSYFGLIGCVIAICAGLNYKRFVWTVESHTIGNNRILKIVASIIVGIFILFAFWKADRAIFGIVVCLIYWYIASIYFCYISNTSDIDIYNKIISIGNMSTHNGTGLNTTYLSQFPNHNPEKVDKFFKDTVSYMVANFNIYMNKQNIDKFACIFRIAR